MHFKLPNLSYNYDALEPFIDKETMEIHHTKHHKVYTDNTNSILASFSEFSNLSEEEILIRLGEISKEKRTFLQNNLGGYVNHNFFWKILKLGTTLKQGKLKLEIEKNFGNLESFKNSFEKIAMQHFGSGWVWLVKRENNLFIQSTANQDNPIMGKSIKEIPFGYPILGLDIWEHAYYLKYQNRKLDYIRSFWNIIDWEKAETNFQNIKN